MTENKKVKEFILRKWRRKPQEDWQLETGISIEDLLEYNDLDLNYTLTIGDILYLRKKKKKASKEYKYKPHVVQAGQSMYDISQMYGLRLKNLYKLNNLKPRKYQIEVGDTLWLR